MVPYGTARRERVKFILYKTMKESIQFFFSNKKGLCVTKVRRSRNKFLYFYLFDQSFFCVVTWDSFKVLEELSAGFIIIILIVL